MHAVVYTHKNGVNELATKPERDIVQKACLIWLSATTIITEVTYKIGLNLDWEILDWKHAFT